MKPAFWSLVLLRRNIYVRESAVLGLVGTGGIGVALQTAMDFFQWDRVARVLLLVFTAILADLAVNLIRRRLI